jgi:hypothetical protein
MRDYPADNDFGGSDALQEQRRSRPGYQPVIVKHACQRDRRRWPLLAGICYA